MRISVVMTTYNGEKYIGQMLDSIRTQTRLVDEVLILDDCSKDNTVKFVTDYIERYQLSGWKIIVNQKNVGWKRNFKNGLEMATGDVIFLSDQDDNWHADKIEKMTAAFEKNQNIWLLASQVSVFTEEAGINTDMVEVRTEADGKVIFDYNYYVVKRPGCSMAMRKDILEIFFRIWNEDMPHDAALWSIANLLGKLYIYDEPLIDYRKHEGNVTNKLAHDVHQALNSPERTKIINEWYLSSEYVDEKKKPIVEYCTQWCMCRSELIRKKKLSAFFKAFKYRKCYSNIKRYFGDLYYYTQKL